MADQNKKFRIGIINGSLRKHSNNTGLARVVESVKPNNFEIIQLKIDNLPLLNQDLQVHLDGGKTTNLPGSVHKLRETVRGLDALLFTSPQNNGSLSGALKNAYDWLSRDYTRFGSSNSTPVGNGKKLAVIGASYISDASLNSVVNMVDDKFYMNIGQSFDGQGNLINNDQKLKLLQWSNNFYNWVKS